MVTRKQATVMVLSPIVEEKWERLWPKPPIWAGGNNLESLKSGARMEVGKTS